MSIVSAIRSIRVILAESAPIATARNACLRFKSRLSNIPSKLLPSRSAQAVQKPTAEELNNIKEKINEIVLEIESRFPGVSDGKFKEHIPSALEARGLTGKELKDFVDKAASVVRSLKGRPEIVLRIMHYRAQ
jgi:hypothetical protein